MVGEIFFIDYKTSWSEKNFKFLKSLYPFVRKIDAYNTLQDTFKIAASQSKTNQFWIIDGSVRPLPSFKFNSDISKWDQQYIHSFNVLVNWKLIPGGVYVATKKYTFEFKQTKILAGFDKSKNDDNFDVVFISFDEPKADENYKKLKEHLGREVLRVHGIKGIHNAHKEAALQSKTKMFWVVDADAEILPKFKFNYYPPRWNTDSVYVWKSKNPVNKLEYGNGGVKLLPRQAVLDMNTNSVDMTTSITTKFKTMPQVSNYNMFNTDPFTTWRSAFRECVKLSSNAIDSNAVNIKRLDAWCTLNESVPYGFYAYLGAQSGRKYGQKNASDKEALAKINDFNWLADRWQEEKSLILP